MNSENVIEVHNLSKVYKIYPNPKARLIEALSVVRKKKYHKEFSALRDLSFHVKKGTTLGIIGKNGAGKSTLLKVLTGIVTPSNGSVEVHGKISALLELGAGFNMEYTGMQNIFLQGTLMGFTQQEMEKKVPDILKFADIGDFIHQPVKTYSSGMFVRLAFSTAINVEPDILIVDEALAVGDIFFQNKCYKKFAEMREKGITILFVSHDIGSIKQFCDTVVWLKDGQIEAFGNKDEVCSKYLSWEYAERNQSISLDNNHEQDDQKHILVNTDQVSYPRLNTSNLEVSGTMDAEIMSFFVEDEHNEQVSTLHTEATYTVSIVTKFNSDQHNVIMGFVIENIKGLHVYTTNNFLNNQLLPFAKAGEVYHMKFKFTLPRFSRGTYLVSPAVSTGNQDVHKTLCWYHNAIKIEIINPGYNLALIEFPNEIEIIKTEQNKVKFK